MTTRRCKRSEVANGSRDFVVASADREAQLPLPPRKQGAQLHFESSMNVDQTSHPNSATFFQRFLKPGELMQRIPLQSGIFRTRDSTNSYSCPRRCITGGENGSAGQHAIASREERPRGSVVGQERHRTVEENGSRTPRILRKSAHDFMVPVLSADAARFCPNSDWSRISAFLQLCNPSTAIQR